MPRHSTTRAGGTSRRTSQPTAMSLWFRWLVTVTLAEALGFLVPAAVGAVLVDAPDTTMALAIVAAGLVEGTFLGAGQAAVARRALPGLPVVRFVALTAVAAAFAYAIAMVPVLLGPRLTDLPWPVVGLLGLLRRSCCWAASAPRSGRCCAASCPARGCGCLPPRWPGSRACWLSSAWPRRCGSPASRSV